LGSLKKITWQQILKGIMDMGGVRQRPAGLGWGRQIRCIMEDKV